MTPTLAHRPGAARRPTAGGRRNLSGGHFMAPRASTFARNCDVAKAPARGAVGRCAAARKARLVPAQGGQEARESRHD